jgi:hypothetical protein
MDNTRQNFENDMRAKGYKIAKNEAGDYIAQFVNDAWRDLNAAKEKPRARLAKENEE